MFRAFYILRGKTLVFAEGLGVRYLVHERDGRFRQVDPRDERRVLLDVDVETARCLHNLTIDQHRQPYIPPPAKVHA